MPETPRTPDPALLDSISADIEAGRTADAATMIAQVEAEGFGGEALDALKDRLARGQFADAMAQSLRSLFAAGTLQAPAAPKNRAQRRAAARGKKRR
jgi:hypothetical protein